MDALNGGHGINKLIVAKASAELARHAPAKFEPSLAGRRSVLRQHKSIEKRGEFSVGIEG